MIPDDVRRFILTSIPSVPHIEGLLLMRREPERTWNQQLFAQRLYISQETAAELLRDLAEAGFILAEGEGAATYRFRPASAAQSDILDRVADAYANNLVEVTNMIHGGSAARVQQFAEAFKFRKD